MCNRSLKEVVFILFRKIILLTGIYISRYAYLLIQEANIKLAGFAISYENFVIDFNFMCHSLTITPLHCKSQFLMSKYWNTHCVVQSIDETSVLLWLYIYFLHSSSTYENASTVGGVVSAIFDKQDRQQERQFESDEWKVTIIT